MVSSGLSVDTAGGRGLPLFPDMAAPSSFRRPMNTRYAFEDPLLRELTRSRPVQRLTRIGFLGAVDRIQSRNWHTRHDHSVGVARLALLYAKNRGLSRHDTRVLAVAGLLHDVGHGPLSHTLEPIFKRQFGITHHKAGFEIIRGESSLGREILKALTRHRLDPDEIIAMIDGTHRGRHAFLFSSPINLDTIDGVTRCRSFFLRTRPDVQSAERIVQTMSETDTPPIRTLDSFWQLKHQMYNSAIHNRLGLLYDGLAQAVVTQDIDDFVPSDFLRDEEQLRRGKRRLFTLLDRARRSPRTLRRELSQPILSHEVDVPRRTFFCNTSVALKTSADLIFRYGQNKTCHNIPLIDLIPTGDPTNCSYQIVQGEFSMLARSAPTAASRRCARPLGADSATTRAS